MTGWDAFAKYVGIQGVMAVLLVAGFVAASLLKIVLPVNYGEIMSFIIGYYFAKNGVGLLQQFNQFMAAKSVRKSAKG